MGSISAVVESTTGAKSRGAGSGALAKEGEKSIPGGGVLEDEAAIDDDLTSFLGVVVGIECRLAASLSCLILTSANEVDGPENRFFNVPRKPSFGF